MPELVSGGVDAELVCAGAAEGVEVGNGLCEEVPKMGSNFGSKYMCATIKRTNHVKTNQHLRGQKGQ